MPKEYTLSFKREAIHRYEQGTNLNALSQEFHIALSTQCQHEPRHQRISESLSRSWTAKEFDFSQRPGRAVHFRRIYSPAAKMRCKTVVFSIRPSARQCSCRVFLCFLQKRRGVPQRVHLRTEFSKKRRTICCIL